MQKFIIQHRRGTQDEWESTDIVLLDGEIAIEDMRNGQKRLLIGDGIHTYDSLPKIMMPGYVTKIYTEITLDNSAWASQDSNLYKQLVTFDSDIIIDSNSKIDLQISPEQLADLQNNNLSVMLCNDDGIVTAYAIGSRPIKNYTFHAIIMGEASI